MTQPPKPDDDHRIALMADAIPATTDLSDPAAVALALHRARFPAPEIARLAGAAVSRRRAHANALRGLSRRLVGDIIGTAALVLAFVTFPQLTLLEPGEAMAQAISAADHLSIAFASLQPPLDELAQWPKHVIFFVVFFWAFAISHLIRWGYRVATSDWTQNAAEAAQESVFAIDLQRNGKNALNVRGTASDCIIFDSVVMSNDWDTPTPPEFFAAVHEAFERRRLHAVKAAEDSVKWAVTAGMSGWSVAPILVGQMRGANLLTQPDVSEPDAAQ